MPNMFFGLNIARSGLYAANVNLNVTANNAANAKTEGYSRQQTTQIAKNPIRIYQGYGSIGAGTDVVSIDRVRDSFYDRKYSVNQTRLGDASAKSYQLQQIENHMNEFTVDGFTKEYGQLFDSIEEMQKDPSSIPAKAAFLNYGQSLMEFFEQVKTNLRMQQEDINAEIGNNVDRINIIAEDIAALNRQINSVELTGASANELRDQRDLLIDELSSICKVQTEEKIYENGKSEFTVKLGTEDLVNNYQYFKLEVEARETPADDDDAPGLYDIYWEGGKSFDPVADGIDGTLSGLLQSRDGNNGIRNENSETSKVVDFKGTVYYINQINRFQEAFTGAMNEIHSKGENLNGESTADIPLFIKSENNVYSVNPELLEDPSKMAVTYDLEQGVNNQNLMDDLLKLREADVLENSSSGEFLQSLVTEAAVDVNKYKTLEENYTDFQSVIQNQRLSVMGVDKDEEAMNLVKYQEAFDLNAKVIDIFQEIYETLINGTGA